MTGASFKFLDLDYYIISEEIKKKINIMLVRVVLDSDLLSNVSGLRKKCDW